MTAMLGLAPYWLQLQHSVQPNQKHANTDGLSHLPAGSSMEDTVDDVETTLFNIAQIDFLPASAQQVRTATMKDPVLSQVLQFMKNG